MPEASAPMGVAGTAPAPRGFVEFCDRQPDDCGASVEQRAEMRIAAQRSVTSTSAGTGGVDWNTAFAEQRRSRAAPPQAVSLAYDWSQAFAQAGVGAPAARPAVLTKISMPAPEVSPPRVRLDSKSWALIVRTNEAVNRAIVQRKDIETYGVEEVWATPLRSGQRFGDCEDYVLEKRRALIAAGLPAQALSIAVVQTQHGDVHAVLLVATDHGDYALDSLTAWVLPWAKTGYSWRERQVAGSALEWAFASTQPAAPPTNLLLASLR